MMRSLLLLAFALVTFASNTYAQAKKALVIGINTYQPANPALAASTRSGFPNLGGSVNDAMAIKDMLQARYQFKDADIKTLYDNDATRANILAAFDQLIAGAAKGDIVFIYYAGHGSQVYNSLSKEADKKDESIVPADAYLGADDIRDKELARLYNLLLDKGVILTAVFDSCHSGSVGRNLVSESPTVRFIEAGPKDAKDASEPVKPESRGALLFAAAQDFEFAREQKDENNIPHGAFTIAFLKSLKQLPPDAPASSIFASVSAILKFYGKVQEPVLAGSETRRSGNLLGLPSGSVRKKIAISVNNVDQGNIELMGGYAFGLSEGIKLAAIGTADTIEIVEMLSVNRSIARLKKGQISNVRPGTLFEVVNWASSTAPALNVYLPESPDNAAIEKYKALFAPALQNTKLVAANLLREIPDVGYYYNEKGWVRADKTGKSLLGKTPSAAALKLPASGKIYINFPPTAALRKELTNKFAEYNNIKVVSDPNDAQYTLTGKLGKNGQLSYGLIKSQLTIQDKEETLPSATDLVAVTGASQLAEYAFRLAKIRDWLMLQNPSDGSEYPFSLAFKYYGSGKPVVADKVKLQDTVSVFFSVNADGINTWNNTPRYIYVFSVDSKGAINLLFPDIESGSVENRFPLLENGKPAVLSHLADFKIVPPVGADHYFMLSSEEPINNLSVFQQDGVLSRNQTDGTPRSPLENLLYTGTKTRTITVLPVNWSVAKKQLIVKP